MPSSAPFQVAEPFAHERLGASAFALGGNSFDCRGCESRREQLASLRLGSPGPSPRAGEPDADRSQIEEALAASRGKVSGPRGAAEALGLPASTVESRIRRLGIDKRAFRRRSPRDPRLGLGAAGEKPRS
jgi:DNA-binding NtrC family response regulator